MPFASASYDATGIGVSKWDADCMVSGTIAFLSSKWSKWRPIFLAMWHYWQWHSDHVMPMKLSLEPSHSLRQENWDEATWHFGQVTPLVLVSVSHNASGIINGTIAFLGQDDWNQVEHGFFIMWCHQHQSWHYLVLLALSMVPLHSLGQGD